jgi:hypothetical protein
MSTRQEVYAAIDGEREYQQRMADNAHGDTNNDMTKPLESFALYMEDYLHEMRTQLSRTWGPDAYEKPLHTLRKIVAIGVSAMEVHGARIRTTTTRHAEGKDLC